MESHPSLLSQDNYPPVTVPKSNCVICYLPVGHWIGFRSIWSRAQIHSNRTHHILALHIRRCRPWGLSILCLSVVRSFNRWWPSSVLNNWFNSIWGSLWALWWSSIHPPALPATASQVNPKWPSVDRHLFVRPNPTDSVASQRVNVQRERGGRGSPATKRYARTRLRT